MLCVLPVLQTRLQAQAAGVPYDGICSMACFETNTVGFPFAEVTSLFYYLDIFMIRWNDILLYFSSKI